jgi:transaldolase
MAEKNYLQWLAEDTPTRWWHDSGVPAEIDAAFANGATGITTNPVLTAKAFKGAPEFWEPKVKALGDDMDFDERAEVLLKLVAGYAAERCLPIYEKTNGRLGYALGQLNPKRAGDAEAMYGQAQRVRTWGKNVCVKLAATGAGIEVVERLAEEGVPVCASVNITVPQALETARAYERGRERAIRKGVRPALCIVVQQFGRLDDFIRDVAQDSKAKVSEGDIRQAGMAVTKRTYRIFKKEKFNSVIMPCAFRFPDQIAQVAGGDFILTMPPRTQQMALEGNLPREYFIDEPISQDVIDRLLTIPEYRRAYEPDGMKPNDFIAYGGVQKVLSQFVETGWAFLEEYGSAKLSIRWT